MTKKFFLHIPKVAGTSIASGFYDRFQDDFAQTDPYAIFYYWKCFELKSLVQGHLPRFLLEALDPSREIYTVLREPTQRCISLSNMVYSEPEHRDHWFLSNNLVTLEEFVHSSIGIDNLQTRMLGIEIDDAQKLLIRNGDRSAYETAMGYFLGKKIDQKDLDNAIRALSNMQIATLEYLDNFINKYFGSDIDKPIPHMRKPAFKHQIPKNILSIIQEKNQFDQQLYKAAFEFANASFGS